MHSRAFGQRGSFGYLEDEDRFLSGRDAPDFRFGFIGCGIMGVEHMRNTLLEGRAAVAGVYDPASKSINHALTTLTREFGVPAPRIYTSLEEACADPDTDALIIATPNFTHLEVLRVAIGSGKAIYLEKPVATTPGDAFEVCRLAADHSNVFRVGLQYRYKAIYAEAIAEVFDRGVLGRVHNVSMLEHRFPFLDKVGQWNKFNEYTGGTLIEKCCHYFDLLNLFAAGRPTQVFASGGQAVNFKGFHYRNRPADGLDHAQLVISYDNGVVGGLSLCMFVPGSREELVVCGERGRLQASEQAQLGDGNENRLELWLGEQGVSRISTPSYPSYIARAGHHGSTFFAHAALVDDIARGSSDGPSLADAFWSVMVGAAAQASICERAAIDVESLLPETFDPDVFSEKARRGQGKGL